MANVILRIAAALAALAWIAATGAVHAAKAHQHSGPAAIESGVAGFDLYRDGAVLHLVTAEFDAARGSRALLHRLSRDGGRTWSRAVRVNRESTSVYDVVRGNEPQVAAYGRRIVVVWTAKGTGYGGSGPLVTAVSHDDGATWREGVNPADDASTAGHAYIDVIAGAAGFDLVWLDGRDGAQGLRHARSVDGSRWSRNVTVQKATCECCWNTLTRQGDALHVMFRGKGPRDMVLATHTEAGWARRSTVGAFNWDFKGCPHTGGGAGSGGERSNVLHSVVWTGAAAHEGLHYLKSTDAGRTWTLPHRVGGAEARRADVAADGGAVLITWDQWDGARRAVFTMESTDEGRRWHKPARISTPGADGTYPRAVATAGGFLVAWTQSAGGGAPELKLETLTPASRRP